ncbi:MAG: endonuclease/exonuclease/phosphatase family protein [Phycisphaerae bacterium]|nr:endonuclease/exonuclease/phosphatase family protein [Phycisphaerae bacterium]
MTKTHKLTRRRFIQGVGLAASTSWLAASKSAVAQVAPPSEPVSHKIMSCNIRVPVEADAKAGNGWEHRKAMCSEIILSHRPDVICLQECRGVQFEYLKDRWSAFEHHGLSDPGPVFEPFNAIFYSRSRYALISAGGFWLSQTPHVAGTRSWDSRNVRFVNWVDLKTRDSNKIFRVWNTHLDHRGQVGRENQARLIVEASMPLAADLPQILTGDMNSKPSNPAIQCFKDGGWTSTYDTAHGVGADTGNTFHGFQGPKYAEDSPDKRVDGQIDWIFYRGKVKVLTADVIRDGRDGRYPSDHYFMSAEVVL